MSDVNRFSNNQHWTGTYGNSDPNRRDTAKRQDKSIGVGISGASVSEHGEAGLTAETLGAFERSIRIAGKALGEKDEEPKGEDQFADARLLAQAETTAAATSMPSFADLTSPAPAASSPAASHLVDTVTTYIQEAIRADMRPSKDTPLTLHLNFAGAPVAGVKGLTMAVTPTTLDVVLERAAGELTPELQQAATELADRLRVRFGKRIVRILDRVTPDGPASEPSLSDLFVTPASRSGAA